MLCSCSMKYSAAARNEGVPSCTMSSRTFFREHNIPFLPLLENAEGKRKRKKKMINGLQENLIKSSHNATGNGMCPVVSVTSGITASPQNPTVLLYSLTIS